MLLEVSTAELFKIVEKQLDCMFVYFPEKEQKIIRESVDIALERCEICFSPNKNKYYKKNNDVYFNPFHSGQYTIFLYFLSNTVYQNGDEFRTLADRLYYLNKCLNGIDIFYEVGMPSIFFLDHPVGSVIGRAVYEDYFGFSQNCTVGNNKGNYPKFGKNVRMMSSSKVIGNCKIGDNVIISANTYIKDVNIPSCSLVFGISPDIRIISKPYSYFITE